MGIVAAVKNLFAKKQAVKVSDKRIPTAAQKALLDQVAYMFDRTNVGYITFHVTKDVDGTAPDWFHVHVLPKSDDFIRGMLLSKQDEAAFVWHKPWDENEHGEEGKEGVKELGISFARTTAAVDLISESGWDIQDVFGIDFYAGEELQFNSEYYWIAKP
jgi:hypothetical protein